MVQKAILGIVLSVPVLCVCHSDVHRGGNTSSVLNDEQFSEFVSRWTGYTRKALQEGQNVTQTCKNDKNLSSGDRSFCEALHYILFEDNGLSEEQKRENARSFLATVTFGVGGYLMGTGFLRPSMNRSKFTFYNAVPSIASQIQKDQVKHNGDNVGGVRVERSDEHQKTTS